MNLSIVIPLFNEAKSLKELHSQICAIAEKNGYQIQLIFVDDGSNDGSWDVLQALCDQDANCQAIRLRRNFGKASAIAAGVELARHELIVTMDADLQDDPAEIPKLIEELDRGFDLVSGWKRDRKDPWTRRAASKIFNAMINTLTKVRLHDHNCGFKLYRREIFDEIHLYGGRHRFVPVLAAAQGFKVSEVAVNHRPRQHGKSRYGATRLVQGFLDLLTVCFLTGFNNRPQHLLGTIGLGSFLLGLAGLTYMAIYWVIRMTVAPEWTPLHQRPLVLYSVAALLLGTQLLIMGFLAELIVARDQTQKPFAVSEFIPPKKKVADTSSDDDYDPPKRLRQPVKHK